MPGYLGDIIVPSLPSARISRLDFEWIFFFFLMKRRLSTFVTRRYDIRGAHRINLALRLVTPTRTIARIDILLVSSGNVLAIRSIGLRREKLLGEWMGNAVATRRPVAAFAFPAQRKQRRTEQIGKQSGMCNRAKQLRILRERRVQTLCARGRERARRVFFCLVAMA